MPDPSPNAARRRRAMPILALAVVALIPLLALAGQPETPATKADTPPPTITVPEPDQLIPALVTRILAPDTVLLEIQGRTLRYGLLGVSPAMPAPHRAHHTAAAIDYLTRTLVGESIYLEHDPQGEFTAANKRAGYLYRAPDMLPINLELIRLGFVRHTSASMTVHKEVFAHWAAEAKEHQRGIWNPDPPAHRLILEKPESEPDTTPAPAQPPETTNQPAPPGRTVYITQYGKSYHRKDCPHLTDTQRTTTRDQVRDTHKPCKTCKPDES